MRTYDNVFGRYVRKKKMQIFGHKKEISTPEWVRETHICIVYNMNCPSQTCISHGVDATCTASDFRCKWMKKSSLRGSTQQSKHSPLIYDFLWTVLWFRGVPKFLKSWTYVCSHLPDLGSLHGCHAAALRNSSWKRVCTFWIICVKVQVTVTWASELPKSSLPVFNQPCVPRQPNNTRCQLLKLFVIWGGTYHRRSITAKVWKKGLRFP